MKLVAINIKNIYGLDFEFEIPEEDSFQNIVIFGQNSTGKSNLMKCLHSHFDGNFLNKMLNSESSIFTNGNASLPIYVSIALEIEDTDMAIAKKEKEFPVMKYIISSYKFVWNNDDSSIIASYYETSINKREAAVEKVFGIDDSSIKWTERKLHLLRSIFKSLYISTQHEIESYKRNYLKSYINSKIVSDPTFKTKFIKTVENINSFAEDMDIIKEIKNETTKEYRNSKLEYSMLGTNIISEISGDFKLVNNEENFVDDLGDGYNRYFSTELQLTRENNINEKNISLFLEEPENNMSILWQQNYMAQIYSNDLLKIKFITTHSPNQLMLNKREQTFIKIDDGKLYGTSLNQDAFKNSRVLDPIENIQASNAIFYKKVMIIEGTSEELFYNFLFSHNESFRSFVDENEIAFLNSKGAHVTHKFGKVFKDLNIKTAIKIDNDLKEGKEYRLDSIWSKYCDSSGDASKLNINSQQKRNDLNKIGIFVSENAGSFESDIMEFLRTIKYDDKFELLNKSGKVEKMRILLSDDSFINLIKDLNIIDYFNLDIFKWMEYLNE